MDTVSVILILVVILASVLYMTRGRRRNRDHSLGKTLPAPKPLPIVGNSLMFDFYHLHNDLHKLVAQYGPIFQLNLMGQTAIVISDVNLLKKAFNSDVYGDVFNDRADSFFGKFFEFDCNGIIFGKMTKKTMQMRKMFHRAMKLYGDGVDNFETISEDEFRRLVDDISDKNQQEFDMYPLLRKSIANSTAILMSGKTPDNDEHRLLWDFIDPGNVMLDSGVAFVLDMFPWTRLLPFGKFGKLYRQGTKAWNTILERYYFAAKRSLSNPDTAEEPGIIKSMFRIRDEENIKANSDYFTETNLKAMVTSLILAATETSTVALYNLLALMVTYRDVAKGVQDEIDHVVGRGRLPKLSDRVNMPFTVATTFEGLRYTAGQGPLSAPHRVMEDRNFEGWYFPKHSVIIPNHWYILRDPKFWKDPWRFIPDRFLDAQGNLLPPEHETRRNFISFGTGSRQCLGENLGKSRLFLYLTIILQSFDLVPGVTEELPDTDPRNLLPGINLRYKNYKIRAIPRH